MSNSSFSILVRAWGLVSYFIVRITSSPPVVNSSNLLVSICLIGCTWYFFRDFSSTNLICNLVWQSHFRKLLASRCCKSSTCTHFVCSRKRKCQESRRALFYHLVYAAYIFYIMWARINKLNIENIIHFERTWITCIHYAITANATIYGARIAIVFGVLIIYTRSLYSVYDHALREYQCIGFISEGKKKGIWHENACQTRQSVCLCAIHNACRAWCLPRISADENALHKWDKDLRHSQVSCVATQSTSSMYFLYVRAYVMQRYKYYTTVCTGDTEKARFPLSASTRESYENGS